MLHVFCALADTFTTTKDKCPVRLGLAQFNEDLAFAHAGVRMAISPIGMILFSRDLLPSAACESVPITIKVLDPDQARWLSKLTV